MSMKRFRDMLWRQLGFLARSCHSFDNGYSDEAIRIAGVIRVLMRQTGHMTSLLTHLDANDIHLLTTCAPHPVLEDCSVFFGLGAFSDGEYLAHLDRASFRRMVPVQEWWNEVVYVLGEGTRLGRKDIILVAADKDGYAHVDANLTPEYERLASIIKVGSLTDAGEQEWQDANAHFAALRQMGYELLNSPELLMQADAPLLVDAPLMESQAIDKYRYLMSERVRQLVSEANHLRPDKPLVFQIMRSGKHSIRESVASISLVQPDGTAEVHLNPDNGTAYTVAQSIMKTILARSGWPLVGPVLPECRDADAHLIAEKVNHLFCQYVSDSRLIDLGFDVTGYRDRMIQDITSWPNMKVTNHALFRAALEILEVMLWDGSYRERVFGTMSVKQPEALNFASKLEKVLLAKRKTKSDMRAAMIDCLGHIDRWVTKETGRAFELSKRILVSPVITSNELSQPARAVTCFLSYPIHMGGASFWVAGLAMKSDGTLFSRMAIETEPTGTEPGSIAEARSLWSTHSLEELLSILSLRFGVACC